MSKPNRTDLGPLFSEGSRLLWLAIQREGLPSARAADAVDADASLFHRWLYGERKPGRSHGNVLSERFGVPSDAWDIAPTEPFAPPGATRDIDPHTIADAGRAA